MVLLFVDGFGLMSVVGVRMFYILMPKTAKNTDIHVSQMLMMSPSQKVP